MLKKFLKKTSATAELHTISLVSNLSNDIVLDSRLDDKLEIQPNSYRNGFVQQHQVDLNKIEHSILNALLVNEDFINTIVNQTTDKILSKLVDQYDFTPTDKYLQEVEAKQQYINQLDAYLEERKGINKEVDNDLQKFLKETTLSLTKALESFGAGVQNQIKEAERRYGIDVIRDSLLQK